MPVHLFLTQLDQQLGYRIERAREMERAQPTRIRATMRLFGSAELEGEATVTIEVTPRQYQPRTAEQTKHWLCDLLRQAIAAQHPPTDIPPAAS